VQHHCARTRFSLAWHCVPLIPNTGHEITWVDGNTQRPTVARIAKTCLASLCTHDSLCSGSQTGQLYLHHHEEYPDTRSVRICGMSHSFHVIPPQPLLSLSCATTTVLRPRTRWHRRLVALARYGDGSSRFGGTTAILTRMLGDDCRNQSQDGERRLTYDLRSSCLTIVRMIDSSVALASISTHSTHSHDMVSCDIPLCILERP